MRYLEVDEYIARVKDDQLPRTAAGDVDRDGIGVALDDAAATSQTYLPALLDGETGQPLDPPPAKWRRSLMVICKDIASWNLYDTVGGDREALKDRYDAAIAQLERLADPDSDDDSDDGSADGESRAAIVEGASQWIPGEARAEDESA
ncbi:MAG: DUF1320 family protein [Spirochaetaceae bacterium]|nr:DUF1320 family protein [Spirochaetaceae bacterium]